jgi:hypothetical protein
LKDILKAVSQILETGMVENYQKIVTKKMETVDRQCPLP